jgi:DNA-binding NtrC family response regulator
MTTTPRILIVDDEERFRQTLAKLLTVRGLDVTTLGSGQEALDALGQGEFDVMVLDVRMPGMNGIETLAKVKKLNPMVEVIILTGHASVDAAVDIMKLGGYDYLLKPASIEELMDKIEAAFERKQAREQRAQKG